MEEKDKPKSNAGCKGKYNKKVHKVIVEMYGSGEYLIKDICSHIGISQETFCQWRKSKTEFADDLDQARENKIMLLGEAAMHGLAGLVVDTEYMEEKIEYATYTDPQTGTQKQKVVSVTRTKKIIKANNSSVQYALNNALPQNFKTAHKIDHTNNGGSFGFGNFLMDADDDEEEELEDIEESEE